MSELTLDQKLSASWFAGYQAGYETAIKKMNEKIREMAFECTEMQFANGNASILYTINLDGTPRNTNT